MVVYDRLVCVPFTRSVASTNHACEELTTIVMNGHRHLNVFIRGFSSSTVEFSPHHIDVEIISDIVGINDFRKSHLLCSYNIST